MLIFYGEYNAGGPRVRWPDEGLGVPLASRRSVGTWACSVPPALPLAAPPHRAGREKMSLWEAGVSTDQM